MLSRCGASRWLLGEVGELLNITVLDGCVDVSLLPDRAIGKATSAGRDNDRDKDRDYDGKRRRSG